MFLKNNRRIEALITVICLALLIFCLVERALRLSIAPALVLAGLYVGRAKPTGRLIFTALSPGCASSPPRPTAHLSSQNHPTLQANILELLGVDPVRPRQ